jgi:hypothetical protein
MTKKRGAKGGRPHYVWRHPDGSTDHFPGGPLGCPVCANHRRAKLSGGSVDTKGDYIPPDSATKGAKR